MHLSFSHLAYFLYYYTIVIKSEDSDYKLVIIFIEFRCLTLNSVALNHFGINYLNLL